MADKNTDKQNRNEYAKKYQAARNEAVAMLIKQHRDEYNRYLSQTKQTHGLQDQAARRLENKKAKAQAALAELQAAGVDVSSLITTEG